MTNNYKVISSGTKFSVKEIKTEQIIASFKTHKEAKQLVNQFNGGKGFNGWTPSFVTKKVANVRLGD